MSGAAARKPEISAAEFKCLSSLFEAWQGLKLLGWQETRYFQFPPDGTEFELIELGSTGIHRAVRSNGYYWVDGDWPSHPFLVRNLRRGGQG